MESAGADPLPGVRVGAIDFAGLTVLALALVVASHVLRTLKAPGTAGR
jgi:hypothetical protein